MCQAAGGGDRKGKGHREIHCQGGLWAGPSPGALWPRQVKGPWGQGATGCSPAARGPGPLQLGPGHSRAVPGGGGDHLWAGHWPQPPPPAGWPGEDCAGHCTEPGTIPRLLGALVHSVGARLNGDPGLMGARLDGEQGWMGSQAGWGARLDGEQGWMGRKAG